MKFTTHPSTSTGWIATAHLQYRGGLVQGPHDLIVQLLLPFLGSRTLLRGPSQVPCALPPDRESPVYARATQLAVYVLYCVLGTILA